MTAATELYEKGLKLAEKNDFAGALQYVQEYLTHCPHDGAALNDAGMILSALGRHNDGLEHLRRALQLTGDTRCLWNLAEVYLAAGQPAAATELFGQLHKEGLLTPDFANRTAEALLGQGDVGGAVECLLASQAAWGEAGMLEPVLTSLRHLRPRVAFFCDTNQDTFIKDIQNSVGQRFETHICTNYTYEGIADLMDWCDIAFFEWCTQQVVTATAYPKKCKIVVRLHRYEAYRPWVEQVQWDKVDALVTVGNKYVYNHLLSRVPDLESRTRSVIIPNGADLERFAFIDRPRGKNLACVARLNLHKNQMYLLHCFNRLHQIDPEYKLYFAGVFQDDVLKQYLEHMIAELGLQDAVFFDGWQDDVSGWLADKHYLVTSSMIENHPVNVLEGMACGLKPVIHAYPGSDSLFPKEYLWRTPEEFCDSILKGSYEPAAYREYVAGHYSLTQQLMSVNGLLCGFERQITPKSKLQAQAAVDEKKDRAYYDTFWSPAQKDQTVKVDAMIDQALEQASQALSAAAANAETPQPATSETLTRPSDMETAWEKIRHDEIISILKNTHQSNLDLLDLGCGRGLLAKRLADYGRVTGIDWSAEGVELAKANCPTGTFLCGNFLQTPLPKESFDIITSVEVIEHLSPDDQLKYLELAYRSLKWGGIMMLTTPNRPVVQRLNEWHKATRGTAWTDQPIENWLNATELVSAAEKAGLTMRAVQTLIDTEHFVGVHLFLTACKLSND